MKALVRVMLYPLPYSSAHIVSLELLREASGRIRYGHNISNFLCVFSICFKRIPSLPSSLP